MAGTVIGIELQLDAQGAIVSARNLGDELDRVQNSAKKFGSGIGEAASAVEDYQMKLQNGIDGLRHIQGLLDGISRSTTGMIEGTLGSFSAYEVGLSRVETVIGKIGDKANDAELVKTFDMIEGKVRDIGKETEFMMSDAAGAFVNLAQAGLDANQALAIIDKTMAFSSASAGVVTLDQAADMATGAIAAMGLTTEEANKALDQMVVLSQTTKMSLEEFQRVYKGMGAAGATFAQTGPEEFLAIAGALRTMGRGAGQVGGDIQSLSRVFGRLQRIMASGDTKALDALGLTKEDFVDPATGQYRNLLSITKTMHKAIEKAEAEHGKALASAMLTNALGNSQQVANVFLLTRAYAEQSKDKAISDVHELANVLKEANDTSLDAQKNFLKTYEGQLQILLGVTDSLKTSVGGIFKTMVQPMIQFGTSLINLMINWIDKNKETAHLLGLVAFGVVIVTTVLGSMIGVLVAAYYAMAGLGITASSTGASLSLASIAAAKFQTTLLPLLGIMAPLVLVMLKFAAVAGFLYYTYSKNLGGIKDMVDDYVGDIRDAFSSLSAVLSGEGIDAKVWDGMSDRAKELTRRLVVVYHHTKAFGSALMEGLLPWVDAVGTAIGKVVTAVFKIARVIREATGPTIRFGEGAQQTRTELEWLGRVIGTLIGFYGALRFAILAAAAAKAIFVAWPVILGLVILGLIYMLYNLSDTMDELVRTWSNGWFDLLDVLLLIVAGLVVVFTGGIALIIGLVVLALLFLAKQIHTHWGAISDFFTGIWESIVEGWDSFWSWFSSGWAQFGTMVENGITEALSFLASLPTKMQEAGRSIINGLIDGIKEGIDKTKDIVSGLAGGIREFFPFSPAKAGPLRDKPMSDAGANIAKDLALGMGQEQKLVSDASTGIAKEVSKTVNGSLSVNGNVSASGFWADTLAEFQDVESDLSISPSYQPSVVQSELSRIPEDPFSPSSSTSYTENNSSQSSVSNEDKRSVVERLDVHLHLDRLGISPDLLNGRDLEDFLDMLVDRLGGKVRDEFERSGF